MAELWSETESWEPLRSVVAIGSWMCFFGAAYGISFMAFRSWRRAKRKRHEAASSTISIIHGTAAAVLSAWDIYESASPSGWDLAAPNTACQSTLMNFSIAYFLVDLAHYVLFVPDDILFILHHIATSSYMISCQYVGHGAQSVMAMLAVGEATSPIQNVWTICRMGRDSSKMMKRIYQFLSPVFTVVFTGFRVFLGPALVWKLSEFYLRGGADGVIPRWLVSLWMGKSTMALAGSLVWVYKLWSGLRKFYGRKKQLEMKPLVDEAEEEERNTKKGGNDEDGLDFVMNRFEKED